MEPLSQRSWCIHASFDCNESRHVCVLDTTGMRNEMLIIKLCWLGYNCVINRPLLSEPKRLTDMS